MKTLGYISKCTFIIVDILNHENRKMDNFIGCSLYELKLFTSLFTFKRKETTTKCSSSVKNYTETGLKRNSRKVVCKLFIYSTHIKYKN